MKEPFTDGATALLLQTTGASRFEVLGSGYVLINAHDVNHAHPNPTPTMNPTVTDDSAAGYRAGSLWINTVIGNVWMCTSALPGMAVWQEVAGGVAPATPTYGIARFNAIGTFFYRNVRNTNWHDREHVCAAQRGPEPERRRQAELSPG